MLFRIAVTSLLLLAGSVAVAQAACTVPNTLTNGTTADATAVMGNFTILSGCAAPLASPALTGNPTITTASGYALDAQSSSANAMIRAKTNSGGGGAYLLLDRWTGPNSAAINFYTASTADYAIGTSVGSGPADSLSIYDYGTSSVVFSILKSNGYIGIGTTSPSYTLHVNGSVAGTSAYNNLSDARLKKNIIPLTAGLALIAELQPVRFEWRDVSERSVGKDIDLTAEEQIGFIAQDLNTVLPEAVSTAKGKDAIMSVAESKIVPVLVAAVKELKAANDNQHREIAVLRTQVESLERNVRVRSAAR